MFFYVPTAILSNGKEFLHLRESSSRVFLRSNSHFKPLQGFSSPSRVIFTCFSTLQFSSPSRVIFTCFSTFHQPFQATARICFTLKNHFHVFFYVPTAISSHCKDFSSPSRVIFMCFSTSQQPFQATSKIFFSHLQCTICPQVPPKGSPVPPKCPLVPRFYPKRLSNILNIIE